MVLTVVFKSEEEQAELPENCKLKLHVDRSNVRSIKELEATIESSFRESIGVKKEFRIHHLLDSEGIVLSRDGPIELLPNEDSTIITAVLSTEAPTKDDTQGDGEHTLSVAEARAQMQGLKTELEVKSGVIERLNQKITATVDEISLLKAEVTLWKEKCKAAQSSSALSIGQRDSEIKRKDGEIRTLQAAVRDWEGKYKDLPPPNVLKTELAMVETLKGRIKQQTAEIEKLTERIKALEADKYMLNIDHQLATHAVGESKANMSQLEDRHQREVAALKGQIGDLRSQMLDLKCQLADRITERERLKDLLRQHSIDTPPPLASPQTATPTPPAGLSPQSSFIRSSPDAPSSVAVDAMLCGLVVNRINPTCQEYIVNSVVSIEEVAKAFAGLCNQAHFITSLSPDHRTVVGRDSSSCQALDSTYPRNTVTLKVLHTGIKETVMQVEFKGQASKKWSLDSSVRQRANMDLAAFEALLLLFTSQLAGMQKNALATNHKAP